MEGAIVVGGSHAHMMAFMALQRILVIHVVDFVAFVRNHNQLLPGIFALFGAISMGSIGALCATLLIAYPAADLLRLWGFVFSYRDGNKKSNCKHSQRKFLHYQFISSIEFGRHTAATSF